MTFCVAWRSGETAFLIADAASTRATRDGPTSSTSTFGEWHKHEDGYAVEESAFKLFRWRNLAVTCAGDVRSIRDFVRLIDDWLLKGLQPWLALAVAAATQKRRPNERFEAIAAARLLGKARLLRLDDDRVWHWVRRDAAVNLGSASGKTRDFVNGAIADALRANHPPMIQLTSVLAACQSLTVHNDLLAEGVGGAFSGLLLDSDGTRWQPDIGYVLLNPPDMQLLENAANEGTSNTRYITCAIRDDILFVSSPETAGTVAFLSIKRPTSPEDKVVAVRRAYEAARTVRQDCCFQFIGVISKQWPQTALVQMHGKARSNDIDMKCETLGPDEKITILMSGRVGEIIRGERDDPKRPRVYICLNEPAT